MSSAHTLLPCSDGSNMTARSAFRYVHRGPRNPGELSYRIEWRPESDYPWWCIWADGKIGRVCKTIADAQDYFGNPQQKAGTQ